MTTLAARIQRWEVTLLTRLSGRVDGSPATRVARWITHTADAPAFLLLPVAVLALGGPNPTAAVAAAVVAFAIERPLYLFLKDTLRRPRPFERLPAVRAHVAPPDRFSFPSGHTSAAVLACTLVGSLHPALVVPLAAWAAAVAASRVWLGVHYPSDVVAGAALGALAARVALAVLGA